MTLYLLAILITPTLLALLTRHPFFYGRLFRSIASPELYVLGLGPALLATAIAGLTTASRSRYARSILEAAGVFAIAIATANLARAFDAGVVPAIERECPGVVTDGTEPGRVEIGFRTPRS
jgi:hypothetical protein